MGFVNWVRETFTRTPVVEAAPIADAVPASKIKRVGYEYGIPLASASSSVQVAATSERQQILNQLHQLYMTCDWVSAAIDTIARTITAGGLQVVSDSDLPEGKVPDDPPPVGRLKRLIKFTNAREDMIQLLRGVATDLLLFGDAYLEIVTLLGEPVALYTLDATTMTVISDQHGEVLGYKQDVDGVRTADFSIDQVIHISLDAPRGGLYGVGPAQKVILPATAWLFTMATLKECFRRGNPPRFHVDLGHHQDVEVQIWREQYRINNLGPKAVGEPLVTTGGDNAVQVLDPHKVTDYLDALTQLRNEIISSFGVPPAKLGIIETGNLGGGTGEAQDKTFRVNTIIPIANLILEKINYRLLQQGYGITDYHVEFEEIDFRDSKTVEEIRDMRLRNGSYTLNRYRDEIGEPPVDGGDDATLVDRQNLVLWSDIAAMSKAMVAGKAGPGLAAGAMVPGVDLQPPTPAPDGTPPTPPPPPVKDKKQKKFADRDPDDGPGLAKDATQGEPPRETAMFEAWEREYRERRRAALRELEPA